MFGFDDMAFHVPRIYSKIEYLTKEKNIEYANLNKGFGFQSMSLADVHEDASTTLDWVRADPSKQAIEFDEYEKLNRRLLTESMATPTNEFYLDTINFTDSLYGERRYTFMGKVSMANQSQLL